MYQALYRKWRPAAFDDVCGQTHITDVLRYETAEKRISHAYLFCGPRGTGKTTCAKILAKAINCHSPVNGNPCGECAACRSIDSESSTDVLELDAASNNGVDTVRAIRDEVNYTPAGMQYRVYIVDEVHMLSQGAFNALLKTLEEPPAHVVFILATTELQKLPATIVSRCQRFDFRRITTEVITDRLLYIAKEENIDLTPQAAHILARHANGGMRDAISLLDLCSSAGGTLTPERVEEQLGFSGAESIRALAEAVLDGDLSAIFSTVQDTVSSSVDLSVFWQDLLGFYRDLLVIRSASVPKRYLDYSDEELTRISATASRYTRERLIYHIRLLDEALERMQRGGDKRMIAELTFIRMSDPALSDDPTALLSRIAALEEKVSGLALGLPPVTASAPKPMKEETAKTAPEEPKEAEVPAVPIPKPSAAGIKPLAYWLELVETLSKENRSAMGMRDGSRAYKDADGGKIFVRFKNKFTMQINSGEDTVRRIAALISAKEGRAYAPSDILFEMQKPDDPEDDFFDGLT